MTSDSNNTSGIGATPSVLNSQTNVLPTSGVNTASSTGTSATGAPAKADALGENEFLTLLITQLKNQDPMNPSDPQEFAKDLATFSQLEQLISINKKLDPSTSGGGLSSLASYLGQQVTVGGNNLHVTNGSAGQLNVNLPSDASNVSIDIMDTSGAVQQTLTLGAAASGDHTVNLSGLSVANGDYTFAVRAVGANGTDFAGTGSVSGVVSGFVPGADPKLIVNGQEISPGDITKVTVPPSAGTGTTNTTK